MGLLRLTSVIKWVLFPPRHVFPIPSEYVRRCGDDGREQSLSVRFLPDPYGRYEGNENTLPSLNSHRLAPQIFLRPRQFSKVQGECCSAGSLMSEGPFTFVDLQFFFLSPQADFCCTPLVKG